MHTRRRDFWFRCSRSAGPSDAIRASERVSPALAIGKRWRFRSFRTYMSIETRAGPTARSVRTLIKKHADLSKAIKDLKDLRVPRSLTCYRHSGPTDLKRTRDVFSVARTVARDRPSPYGEGVAFFYRSAGACPPRALKCACTDVGEGNLRGPSPYDEGGPSAAAAPIGRAYPRKRG